MSRSNPPSVARLPTPSKGRCSVTAHARTFSAAKAKGARFHILDVIEKEIATPRENISPYAPEIRVMSIDPEKIGLVIGSGGKTINEIKEQTGTEIDIEDDGTIFITGKGGGAEQAMNTIAGMTKVWKAGEEVEGTVVKIMDFGAFVSIGQQEGLVHISEMAPFRVEKVTDLLKEGDKVPIVVKAIDDSGRLKLSIKDRDKDFFKDKEPKKPEEKK